MVRQIQAYIQAVATSNSGRISSAAGGGLQHGAGRAERVTVKEERAERAERVTVKEEGTGRGHRTLAFCVALSTALSQFRDVLACLDVHRHSPALAALPPAPHSASPPLPAAGGSDRREGQEQQRWRQERQGEEERKAAESGSVALRMGDSEEGTVGRDGSGGAAPRLREGGPAVGGMQERGGEYLRLRHLLAFLSPWFLRLECLVCFVDDCRWVGVWVHIFACGPYLVALALGPALGNAVRPLVQGVAESLRGGPFLDALEARKRAAQGGEREQLGAALGEAVRPLVQGVAEWAVLGNVDARNEEFFVRCSAVATSKDVLWQEGFWMDEAMVPVRLIPLSLAQTILRVGKSIRFLAHCCGDRLGPEAAKQVEREVRGARASLELRDVPRLVERVSAQVETRLVQVVVGQFNLLHHCALIKRFILLTNGHFAQVLLDEASSELKKPVNKVSTIALSGALHGAVLASLFSGEEPALADALQVKLVNDSLPVGPTTFHCLPPPAFTHQPSSRSLSLNPPPALSPLPALLLSSPCSPSLLSLLSFSPLPALLSSPCSPSLLSLLSFSPLPALLLSSPCSPSLLSLLSFSPLPALLLSSPCSPSLLSLLSFSPLPALLLSSPCSPSLLSLLSFSPLPALLLSSPCSPSLLSLLSLLSFSPLPALLLSSPCSPSLLSLLSFSPLPALLLSSPCSPSLLSSLLSLLSFSPLPALLLSSPCSPSLLSLLSFSPLPALPALLLSSPCSPSLLSLLSFSPLPALLLSSPCSPSLLSLLSFSPLPALLLSSPCSPSLLSLLSFSPLPALLLSSPCSPSLLSLLSFSPLPALLLSSPCSPSLLSLLSFSPLPALLLSSPCSPSLLSLLSISPLPALLLSSPCSPPLLSLLSSSPLPALLLSSPCSPSLLSLLSFSPLPALLLSSPCSPSLHYHPNHPPFPLTLSTPGISGWDVFTLEYRILPPLTAVITTTAQHHYARLFTALFLLQRTRRALSSTWLALKPRASRLLPPVVRESITATVSGRFAGGLGSRAAGAGSKARKPDPGGIGHGFAAAGAGTAGAGTAGAAAAGAGTAGAGTAGAAAAGAGGGSLEGDGGGGEGGARVTGGLQAWKEREEEKLLVGPVRGVRGVFARMSQFMRVIETFAALRIETSWKEMVEGAKGATNLDELIACHERYQQALLKALFLDRPSAAILSSVRRTCRLVLEVSHLAARLQKHTDSLFARKLAATRTARASSASTRSSSVLHTNDNLENTVALSSGVAVVGTLFSHACVRLCCPPPAYRCLSAPSPHPCPPPTPPPLPSPAAAAPVNVYAAAVDAMLRPVNASAAAVGTAGCCWVRTVLQSTPTPTDCPASQMSAPPPFARLAFSFSSHALRTLALLAAAATAQNRRPASTIHQTPVLPGLILIRPLSSQLVAHTGVAMVGAWSAQAAAALHPTHPQLTEAASVAPFSALTCHPTPPILPLAAYSPIFSGSGGEGKGAAHYSAGAGSETFTSAFFPPPFSVLICPLSSQQVARTGVAVAGDMECTGSSCSPPNPPAANRSLAREWQWRGTWSAQAAAALHPTHPQLILSLQVEGRGVGVNTAAPSHPSPVAVQVAVVTHTEVAVAGDMECTGSSRNPPAAKFLPCLSTPVLSCVLCCISCFFSLQMQASVQPKLQATDPFFLSGPFPSASSDRASPPSPPRLSSSHSLFLCGPLQVEGRGVGVNTATPSRLSPVAVQVAVVGGEGGSTPLGWDGMGEYRAGSSESRSGSGKDMECTGSSRNPPAAKFLPCLSTPTLSCVPCCISCFFSLQTQASGSAKAWGSTPIGWGGRKRIGLGRLNQGHVGSGEGGSIPLGWDGKGEYRAGLSETRRHEGELWGGWEGSMGASGQLTALGAASSGVVRCGSGCGGWDLRGTALGAQVTDLAFKA
ncbi:unnamed protein product [Closterium sp. NIES-65]|nr:unnamed protein product [Closterium sp. NIES-65]